MQQKARIWTVPTLILALVLGLSLTAVPAKAQILKDLKELKEIAEDVQCTLGQTGCTQSEEAVSDEGASFPSESATPPGQGVSTPAVGDGEYALTFSPPFQSLDISGRAFAVMLDGGVRHIVFCQPETGEGGGGIQFTPGSRNDFMDGEWTVGSGSSSLGRVMVNLYSRDPSTRALAQFDVGNRWGSKGTLTMGGYQDGFLVGSLTGEGTGVTSVSDPRQPVQVALSLRARRTETDPPPDCYAK